MDGPFSYEPDRQVRKSVRRFAFANQAFRRSTRGDLTISDYRAMIVPSVRRCPPASNTTTRRETAKTSVMLRE
jgi:hypothetical protein